MPHRSKPLIVIADGEHARLMTTAEAGGFRTVGRFDSVSAHKRSSDLGTAEPGRTFESGSTARHGIAPRHDLHQEEKERFAALVAQEIQHEWDTHAYDSLILAALPHTMNDLRKRLAPQLLDRITKTIPKDLVRIPDHQLGEHLYPPRAS